ncbi:thiopeptide-type bacteriocin [Veronia nyctiphanis]|uniref:thiopeptide-type bacteriocin n=1 Tax=Veronia nyctiphanis TaxID=1278244 RepID=UPI001375A0AA|nr:thiopeptide-type bacteriocin [Veronia nyctiphanis]
MTKKKVVNKITSDLSASYNLDFEILETSDATALEEMGASSTIFAGSTCSKEIH